ncbi:hypothetical protein N2152v2_010944 [Parachlorella kessleri]
MGTPSALTCNACTKFTHQALAKLNSGLSLTWTLVPPFTVILGSTYPLNGSKLDSPAKQAVLVMPAGLCADLAAQVVDQAGRVQSLSSLDVQPFLLAARMTSVKSDPVITGFDGKSFHFDSVGEFALLESGDGLKVHVTFAGATTGEHDPEKAWTSRIRIISPSGDMVSCSLPAILPNTSRVQMTATPADAGREMVLVSPASPVVTLGDMTASAILQEAPSGTKQAVAGCRVTTHKFEVVVQQISGWEQASMYPDMEAWAAPFTWLNTGLRLTRPLTPPVTGILGSTYPIDSTAEQAALGTQAELGAEVVGEAGGERSLSSSEAQPFLLTAGMVGLAVNEASTTHMRRRLQTC